MATWYLVTGATNVSGQTSSSISITADNVKYMPIIGGNENYNSTSLLDKTNIFTFRKGSSGSHGFTYSGLFSGESTTNYSCLAIYTLSSSYKQGNISQFLVRDDSALFNYLSEYNINKTVARTLSGKYRITALENTYNYINTNLLSDRYYTDYYARLWLPLFDVKLNGVDYDYIACRCTATYGYQGTTSFSDASISNIYGCKKGENSLTRLTLSVNDIIDLQGDDIPINTFWYNLLSSQQRVWEYSDTIYNYNGDTILSILEQTPPVNAIDISVTGDDAIITYHYIDNTNKSVEISIPQIENRTFIGLSLKPFSSVAFINADGEEHQVSGILSSTFYLAYSKVNRPFTDSFEMNIYQNISENNRVDKTNYLTQLGTINGVLRESTSITEPVLTLEMETVPTFNYVYIPAFNRYYFVTEINSIRYNLWEISLSVDVLMTYKDGLYNLEAFINRSENNANNYIVDSKRVVEQGYDIELLTLETEIFDSNGSYVLTGFNLEIDNSGG